jgi:restriction endonuclease S subunit
MKTLKITIPSILEQEKIANFLSDIDDKIKNIN